MKKLTKKLALLLSVAMIFSLLAACGKQEPPVEETTAPVEMVEVLDSVDFMYSGDTDTYTVGENLSTDGFITITGLEDSCDDVVATYNPDGTIAKVVETDKDDGKTETTEWVYEEGLVVSSTYRTLTFRSDNDITYEYEKDDAGRIIKCTETVTLTDKEDGSVSERIDEYEYTYDENGRIVSAKYYTKGELDHTTNLTYDESGKLLVYSNVGSSMGEYIRMTFNYKSVEKAGVNVTEIDANKQYFNIDGILAAFI